MRATITKWAKVQNETTGNREIYLGTVEGSKFGALVTIERSEQSWVLVVDRADRRRRTVSVLETLDHAKAAAAHLIN